MSFSSDEDYRNNNNNNNKHDNVYGAVIMADPLREFMEIIVVTKTDWSMSSRI